MNITDIIVLIILGFAAYHGYRRGFMVSLLSIIAFFVAIIMAFFMLDWGVQMLHKVVNGFSGMLPFFAFVLIFAGVAIGVNLVGKMFKKAIDLTLLGSLDSFGGSIVGLLKWAFGLSLLIWLSQTVGFEVPANLKDDSVLYSKIEPVAPFVIDRVSEYLPFLKSLFQSIAEHMQPDIP